MGFDGGLQVQPSYILSRDMGIGGEHAMEERLMKPKELAERLGTSMDWVYRHWKELPFTVKLSPRQLRFSEKGLEQYLERSQKAERNTSLLPSQDD